MTNVDQFESTFRAADKPRFVYAPTPIHDILVLTDLDETAAYAFGETLKHYLAAVEARNPACRWRHVDTTGLVDLDDLVAAVRDAAPDLVCTHRHLMSGPRRSAYALGGAIEVLTQATRPPILIAPHPDAKRDSVDALRDTNAVMAITDHLTGDDHLVNIAASFTEPNGTLFLAHVEDDATFERYIATISRIPNLDTDTARRTIRDRLLKEPADYIESCRAGLGAVLPDVRVESIVTMGDSLESYRRLVADHHIDLLVFNTKDADQLAMHGLAHPLAVEIRAIPLLML